MNCKSLYFPGIHIVTAKVFLEVRIHQKKIENRCKKKDQNGILVKNYCSQTCGVCTSRPSMKPSPTPSDNPSATPSQSHNPSLSPVVPLPTVPSLSPSLAPTKVSESNCQDSEVQKFKFAWNTSTKSTNCKKLFKKANPQQIINRCKLIDTKGKLVRKYCLKTCGICCEDTSQEFLFSWSSTKSNCEKLLASANTEEKKNSL
mmetsp:Transcript_36150/g.84511  ORF Transcript_36150/g.84511 Transcript_36150/m.84511 type:complete len:202 (+) Transcript_36150:471-1076(+)